MTNKYGPSKGELKFRLIASVLGFGLLGFALAYRGIPTSAAGWEAIGIGTLFFGGTFLWTLRKLIKKDFPDAL